MTRKDIIAMAREAGFESHDVSLNFPKELERFAALVRADEAEKYKWDVHSCGPTCTRYACVATRKAVEVEREKCAKLVEEHIVPEIANEMARIIRTRGNT